MSVTIKDIAEKVGVSSSTVSRVLNNKGRIAAETRKKVMEAAEELGYEVKNQVDTEGKKIGLLFNSTVHEQWPQGHNFVDNFFYSQVIDGVESVFEKYNYNLFLRAIQSDSDANLEKVSELIEDDFAGFIIVGYGVEKEIIKMIRDSNIPLVLIDNMLWDEKIDCVVNDNLSGSREIVNHLINLGHEKISFIGGPLSHVSLDERYVGYKQALKQAGIEKNNELITFCEPTFTPDDGYKAAEKILKEASVKPTAFFGAIDGLAVGIMEAVKELGYVVPDDISVVGFDDINMSKYLTPSLTTIRTFKREMGVMAAERIHQLMQRVAQKPVKLVISVEPVIRDSAAEVKKK